MPDESRRQKVSLRLHPDVYERVRYWSDKKDVPINEWLQEAVEEKIARANGDYDLPTLEIARLNQLRDEVAALSTNVGSLEQVVINMASSILGLAKGDNYLIDDDDDGELPIEEVGA